MGGLGMVSKVVISVVLLACLWSMEASGGRSEKKIGSVGAFLSTTVATGQMGQMKWFWFKNGLGGTKLENVANLRGKGAAMLAY